MANPPYFLLSLSVLGFGGWLLLISFCFGVELVTNRSEFLG